MKNKKIDLDKVAGGSAQTDFDSSWKNYQNKKGKVTEAEAVKLNENIKALSSEQEAEKKRKADADALGYGFQVASNFSGF